MSFNYFKTLVTSNPEDDKSKSELVHALGLSMDSNDILWGSNDFLRDSGDFLLYSIDFLRDSSDFLAGSKAYL